MPARALPSLDELRCRCAEGALSHGDYNACVALFSRRLVVAGEMTRAERSELLGRSRSNGPPVGCSTSEAGWGVAAVLDEAFVIEGEPGGSPALAAVSVRLWNHSSADVHGVLTGGAGCLLRWRVVEAGTGLTVWDNNPICVPGVVAWQLPAGSAIGWTESLLPLVAINAENGLRDGDALPPGVYRIEVTWQVNGPQAEDRIAIEGGFPAAAIPLRILPRD